MFQKKLVSFINTNEYGRLKHELYKLIDKTYTKAYRIFKNKYNLPITDDRLKNATETEILMDLAITLHEAGVTPSETIGDWEAEILSDITDGKKTFDDYHKAARKNLFNFEPSEL